MRGVNLEINGLAVDALVITGNSGGLAFNLPLHIRKVCEAAAGDVMKLCPLGSSCSSRRSETIFHRVWKSFIFGDVDELEDKGSTGADATASREKVSADNIFENGGFASRLRSDNNLEKCKHW